MNPNMFIKLVIDLIMTVSMLVAMAYHITGNMIHELVGVFLFVLFMVHNILNRRWYKTIFRGKYKVQQIISMAVNLLFLLTIAVALISSVPISRDIFPFIPINNDMTVRQIHVLSAYWGFILMAVHIGISWGRIINAARKMTGIITTSRVRTIAFRFLAVLIVVYGVQISFERDMGSRLLIYNPFGYWGFDETALRFVIDYLAIMGIYICGTHYTLKYIQKHEKAKA
ncbi:magnesium-transporting ATPase (P-type) [Paenibacillus sp. V4I3]|uniref:DUF4405 domain-containing protein n=1 Tax=Paenibacillus sp. V4I3 TaxID=3042305 RepID=UPI0027897870|nr:DUF4405 domain-containing protein [Paenibacillus sp. V4I3]MDQ0877650.1 magnesium-transporting ATPase (P-type) [Paenibacillus sp. V4I3]